MTKQDFRQLRWPLLGALVLLLAGVAALIQSERYLDDAKQLEASAKTQRSAAQDRVAKASEEERTIRNHLVFYQRMVASGIVGAKDRLDLIERISAIKNQRKLFEIKYNIEPQRALDYPGITQTGSMDFVTSRMQLDMLLLHEEDLFNFLRDLQQAGQAFVSVRQCRLVRQERGASPGVSPNVQAQCVLDMITLVSSTPAG